MTSLDKILSKQDKKEFPFLNNVENELINLNIGDYFIYSIKLNGKTFYKKGLKVTNECMIPIGLICENVSSANNQ